MRASLWAGENPRSVPQEQPTPPPSFSRGNWEGGGKRWWGAAEAAAVWEEEDEAALGSVRSPAEEQPLSPRPAGGCSQPAAGSAAFLALLLALLLWQR